MVRDGDGEYELVLPRPVATDRLREWGRLQAIDKGALVADGEGGLAVRPSLVTATIGICGFFPLALGLLPLAEVFSAFASPLAGVAGVLGGLVASLFVVIVGGVLFHDEHADIDDTDPADVVIVLELVAATVVSLVTAPDVAGAAAGELVPLLVTGANLVGGAVFAVLGGFAVGTAARRAGAKAVGGASRLVASLRDGLRGLRGIDHRR